MICEKRYAVKIEVSGRQYMHIGLTNIGGYLENYVSNEIQRQRSIIRRRLHAQILYNG